MPEKAMEHIAVFHAKLFSLPTAINLPSRDPYAPSSSGTIPVHSSRIGGGAQTDLIDKAAELSVLPQCKPLRSLSKSQTNRSNTAAHKLEAELGRIKTVFDRWESNAGKIEELSRGESSLASLAPRVASMLPMYRSLIQARDALRKEFADGKINYQNAIVSLDGACESLTNCVDEFKDVLTSGKQSQLVDMFHGILTRAAEVRMTWLNQSASAAPGHRLMNIATRYESIHALKSQDEVQEILGDVKKAKSLLPELMVEARVDSWARFQALRCAYSMIPKADNSAKTSMLRGAALSQIVNEILVFHTLNRKLTGKSKVPSNTPEILERLCRELEALTAAPLKIRTASESIEGEFNDVADEASKVTQLASVGLVGMVALVGLARAPGEVGDQLRTDYKTETGRSIEPEKILNDNSWGTTLARTWRMTAVLADELERFGSFADGRSEHAASAPDGAVAPKAAEVRVELHAQAQILRVLSDGALHVFLLWRPDAALAQFLDASDMSAMGVLGPDPTIDVDEDDKPFSGATKTVSSLDEALKSELLETMEKQGSAAVFQAYVDDMDPAVRDAAPLATTRERKSSIASAVESTPLATARKNVPPPTFQDMHAAASPGLNAAQREWQLGLQSLTNHLNMQTDRKSNQSLLGYAAQMDKAADFLAQASEAYAKALADGNARSNATRRFPGLEERMEKRAEFRRVANWVRDKYVGSLDSLPFHKDTIVRKLDAGRFTFRVPQDRQGGRCFETSHGWTTEAFGYQPSIKDWTGRKIAQPPLVFHWHFSRDPDSTPFSDIPREMIAAMTVKWESDRFHHLEKKAGRELIGFSGKDAWAAFQAFVNPTTVPGAARSAEASRVAASA